MQKFEALGLSPEIIQAIQELEFIEPTTVQEKVIPLIYETDSDLIGLSQTGTGKTAAFGLPLIDSINSEMKKPQALILAPTRELCVQIAKDLTAYSKYKEKIRVVPVYGGANIETQIRALRIGAHIVCATPGRMLDLINRGAADISKIQTLVLDEADEMLNMGFRDELDAILETSPDEKRTLLFSATMSKEVSRIAKNYLSNPVKIPVGTENAGAENVKHIYYQVHARDRYLALKRIADINPDIYGIVFCRTRMETKEVADKLIKDGYSADALHGDLSQVQRDNVMEHFRNKTLQMLIATDVAARGIDVSNISHVINYNLPEEIQVYTHRTGRTGRANKSGVAISIVNYQEKRKVPEIERIIKKKLEKLPVPSGSEICEKQLFHLIDKIENVAVDDDQIAPFMTAVNMKLDSLSKEQIIKKFVSLEFTRFLDYYKDAPDLNKKAMEGIRDDKKGGSKSRRKSNNQGLAEKGYSRFYLNLGKKDGLNPARIIGLVNEKTRNRNIRIGEIDLLDSFSFFEAEQAQTDLILESFNKSKFKDRKIRVELAQKKEEGKKKKDEKKPEKSGMKKKKKKK